MSVRLVRAYLSRHGPGGAPSGEVRVTARIAQTVVDVILVSAPVPPTGPVPAEGVVRTGPLLDEHLVVRADAIGLPWLPIADVIVLPDGADPGGRAPVRPRNCPGALVTSVADSTGRCSISTRNGEVRLFTAPGPTAGRALPWVASFAHAWIASGHGMAALGSASLEVGWPHPRHAGVVLTSAEAPAQCRPPGPSGPGRPASRSRTPSA